MTVRPIRNAAGDGEILIYDEIGFFGVRAADIVAQLKAINAQTIHVRINSPGGDVMDTVTIFNALRNAGVKIVTHVDGLAASSASLIAMAGDEIRMADNAFLMIHEPFGFTIGTARDHRAFADVLDRVSAMIVDTYRKQTDATEKQVKDWMDAETWFTAKEAKEAGLIDEIDGQADVEAAFDLSQFRHPPERLRASGRIAAHLTPYKIAALATGRPTPEGAPMDDVTKKRLADLETENATLKAAAGTSEVQALRTENAALKLKVDGFEVQAKERDRHALIEKKITDAKLPAAVVTDVFRKTLQNAKDEAEIDAAIADRKTIAVQAGGTAAVSVERIVRDPNAPAFKGVDEAVVAAAGRALFS